VKKLAAYATKRDFSVTPEPRAGVAADEGHAFVVQKHAARRLHYDFRLELDGVLKSWAVPRGPSLSPSDKRLAVEVEDHPVDYRDFEGTIPKGQYGGGEVIVWDRGVWTPVGDPHEGLRKGHLRFVLAGEKLAGEFSLVRMKTRDREKRTSWLLLKSRDEHVREGDEAEITERAPGSVLTGRTIEDVAAGVKAGEKKAQPRKVGATKSPDFAQKPQRSAKTAKKMSLRSLRSSRFEPQLATLVDQVPAGAGWLFEMKLDGYRALAVVEGGEVRLTSRKGQDWSERFSVIAEALRHLRVKDAVLDGEVCLLDDEGRTSFQGLQNALSAKDQSRLAYIVFDLLYRDGEDLRGRPLVERKEILATLLAGERLPLRLSEHLAGDGEAIHAQACRLGVEGIMAKRADAPYASGRTRSWLKIKCGARQELVILGFTAPRGARSGLGALVLGVRGPTGRGALRYVGKVGTGFTAESLADLQRRLQPLARATPPVPDAPRVRGVTWVEPELVCEVGFTEWTQDGALRHPTFMGLREDKPAADVVREREEHVSTPKVVRAAARKAGAPGPVMVRKVTITHADRVVDEASGVTKGDLARYYDAVAGLLLPYAKRRPLAIVRCPGGKDQKCFFQKHVMPGMGEAILSAQVGDQGVLYVSSAKGILELAQFGAVELHGWGSHLPAADRPDWIVLDLDPDEALPWGRVVEAALEAREVLRSIGLASWVKTTGGKGLHVVAPFRPKHGWDVVKRFAHVIAEDFERRAPEVFTSAASKAARPGKIFVDYLRNGEGATAVLPYSARARAQVPVALPVAWDDLRNVHPGELTVRTVPGLVARRRKDPWADFFTAEQSLPPEIGTLLAAKRSLRSSRGRR
jgi:bifunctional non-homologous end joining protein LigD